MNAYNDTGGTVVTSVTCEAGTFIYDRYEEDYGGSGYGFHVWTDGEKEIISIERNLEAGDWVWRVIFEGGVPVGEEEYYITSVGTAYQDGTYVEPWVSMVESRKIYANGGWEFEYVGEVDVYEGIPS